MSTTSSNELKQRCDSREIYSESRLAENLPHSLTTPTSGPGYQDKVKQAGNGGAVIYTDAPPQSPSMRSESASKTHCSPSAALNMLASTDWEEKVNGLTALSDLVTQNPAAFTSPSESISQVVIAVTAECRNLRSQVCH
ncbi:unnamed protein product [Dibothriocephalus latus]|uniref:Uncharacterized protein n=1 Tax=Dibothriocephalus latus TaxID=60516 RepID=A0A3P7QIY4_DIBLA|nr:unnamed protein product [Dibothriocephalus latus]